MLPHRQAPLWPRTATPRLLTPTPARPLLLLPRSRLRSHPPALADLVPLHPPGLRQRPRLARPPTVPGKKRLRANRQRLHPTRRPRPGPTSRRPLLQAPLAHPPGTLGTP